MSGLSKTVDEVLAAYKFGKALKRSHNADSSQILKGGYQDEGQDDTPQYPRPGYVPVNTHQGQPSSPGRVPNANSSQLTFGPSQNFNHPAHNGTTSAGAAATYYNQDAGSYTQSQPILPTAFQVSSQNSYPWSSQAPYGALGPPQECQPGAGQPDSYP